MNNLAKQLELFTTDEEIDTVEKIENKYEIKFKSGTAIRIVKEDLVKLMQHYFSVVATVSANPCKNLDADTVSGGVWSNSNDGNNYTQEYYLGPPPQYNPADENNFVRNRPPAYNPQEVAFPAGFIERHNQMVRELPMLPPEGSIVYSQLVPWTRESDEAQQGAGERARREILENAERLVPQELTP